MSGSTSPLPLSGAIQPSAASNAALNNGTYDPSVINDLYYGRGVGTGAGVGGAGGGGGSSPSVQQQSQFAESMRGANPGATLGALQQARSQDADIKAQRIQQAMSILQANKDSQTTNLPLLAAAGAMLAPTRTGGFSESLGNAMTAAVQPTQVDRTRDTNLAGAMGRLGIEGSDVPLQNDMANIGDFWRQMQLAEQAGSSAALADTRTGIAREAQTSRENVAQIRADAVKTAAQTRSDALVAAWRERANAPPAAVKLFDFVTNPRPNGQGGFEPPLMSVTDATTLLNPHQVANDPSAFARAVAAQEKMLADNNMMHGNKKSAQDIHQQALDNVQKTYSLTPNARRPLGNAPDGTSAPIAPAPGAPAPAPGGTTAKPAAPGAMRAPSPAEVQAARDAIAKGAPRSAVLDRFKQNGITPPDLGP